MSKIKVLFVDDSWDFAQLYKHFIDGEEDMVFVGALASADRLVDTVQNVSPDVVVLDLRMPGRDPLEVLRDLSSKGCDTKVLLFSGLISEELRLEGAEAGAWGLIAKDEEPEAVLKAIRRVAAGEMVFSSHQR